MKIRRVVSVIVALVTAITFVASPIGDNLQGLFGGDTFVVRAEENELVYPFGYESADVFTSDALLGRATDSDGSLLGFTQFAYEPVLYPYAYKTIAEGVVDDEWLMGSSVFWTNAGDCLDADVVDLLTWKQVMYETIIMDWLTYQFESEEFESEYLKSSYKYGWKIIKYLEKKGDIYDEDDLGGMSVEDAMNILDDEFYEQNEILGKLENINKLISTVADAAKDGIDYYKNITKVLAAREACECRIEFLQKVKEVSSDEDLCKAIDNVTEEIDSSFAEIAFDESEPFVGKAIAKIAWKRLCEWSKMPGYDAIKLGKAGMDWLFNTKELSSKNVELAILYIVNADFTNAYQQIRQAYINNPNEETAVEFNNAFQDYVNYQAYATSITEEYIGEVLYEGFANKIYNLFSDKNIQKYDDLKSMMDADIDICAKWYDNTNGYYNLYNNILSKNEYMKWYNDNQVSVTGIHFEKDTVEWGTEDDGLFSSVPAILEPENAGNQNISYTSSDESVISIKYEDSYIVDIKNAGTAVITATSEDGGYTATMTVNVVAGHGKDGDYIESTSSGGSSGNSNNDSESKSNGLGIGARFTVGVLTYYVTGDGEVEVDDCDTSAQSVNIPKYVSYEGYSYRVTSIGYWAFKGAKFTSVTLPDSVINIKNGAFYECKGLTSVTLPGNVTNIGDYSFEYCSSLTNITIPESVESIGYSAFKYCTSLTNITIPNSVSTISSWTFEYCTALTNITIPDSVKGIGNGAFYGCVSLTDIKIPDGVSYIMDETFSGCTNLTNVTIPDSVKSIRESAFYCCTSLVGLSIPDNVSIIGDYSFEYCSSLTNISIPDSVTNIGNKAFSGCTSLKSISVESNNEHYLSQDGVLFDKNKRTLIQYPVGKSEKSYLIPNSVTKVENSAFSGCTSLTNIIIPDSVTEIGERAFYRCTSLESITIPDGVTSIEDSVFSGCTSLTSITIPEGVTSVGSYAFYKCTDLTSVTLPNSVTSIGVWAFDDCINLTNITIPEGVTEVPLRGFSDCTSLMSVTIPKSVTSIGIFSFLACTNLTDVYYTGSENDWSNITMDEGNYHLTNATIHYNYDPNKTYIQTIELNKQSLSLKSGKSETLTATISPENATDKNITWTSSDEKVATVDSNGKVTGVAEGTATITATAADGSEAKGSCTVTVTASTSTSNPSGDKGTVDNKNVSVKSIKLDKTTANLNNGKTVLLKATVSPSNATNKAVKWKSSNTKVAKVDKNGKVTAVGKGKAKITCTTKDGSKTASCNIIVKQLVTKIKLNKTKATIKKGKTLTLKATVAPTNANNKKVKWKSSNTKVATVSSRGKVTARKKGTATITCTAADGSGRKVTCKVTVK